MSKLSDDLWPQNIVTSPHLSITLAIATILLFYFLFSSSQSKQQNKNKNLLSQNVLQNNDDTINTSYSEYEYGTEYEKCPLDGGPQRASLHVLIDPPEKKWLLQSRVANAKTPSDFFAIFDEFDILHKLKLPVRRLPSDLAQLTEQTFRDLVRDKININDELVRVDDAVATSPELFRSYFHNRIKEVISDHLSDLDRIDTLALYICCHLSRTRAGGDTLFAVRDIFDSPQV
jgi:hypothetical protein